MGCKLKILLVEDNPGDARLIQEMLEESQETGFEIDWVTRLSEGLEKMRRGGINLVLLDLGLPDSQGLETFIKAYSQAPQVPMVVLTGLRDETVALTAVREGAQDFLVKGQTDGIMLFRAIRYATERKKVEEALRRANQELRREIEERRAAEMAVEAERQRFFAVLEQLPAFVSLIAPDFSLVFANHVFENIFGSWQGRRCHEVIFAKTEACEDCPAVQVLENRTFGMKEMKVPGDRVYSVYKYPFTDVDGTTLVLSLGIDITQRKRAEEAVEAERQRLFALLDGLPAMVYLKAPDYSIRFANRVFKEMVGPGNWNGKRCFEALLRRNAPCEDCHTARVFETGIPNESEWTNPFSQQAFQIHNYPFVDVDGSSLVLTLGFDVTQRKKAEEALRQSQSRLAEAQRIARLGHWECDLRSGQVVWSEEVYRIFGLNPEEFTPSLKLILSHVHPEDRERVHQGLRDAQAGVKSYNLVNRLVRPDGSVRYVHSQAEAVFDEDGKPRRILGTAQDITERRRAEMRLRASEERFRAIFEGAGIGISLVDLEGRIMTVNAAQLKMLGYREEELQGKTLMDITHPDDRARNMELFAELKLGLRDNYQLEKRLLRQDGSDFWGRVMVSLVRGLEGEPRCGISTTEDITARKEAREKLRQSETSLRLLTSQLLTAQEDERRRISRELHDEMGQGLLVLKLQAKAIENALPPEQQEIRNECREMRNNLDAVVNNVRRLSRDLSPMMLEDLGLSAALRRLIQEFSKHYHIDCNDQESEINDLFPLEIQVTIYRLFQECLTNIGKHSQASQLTVAINKTYKSVSFVIQDNGKGFNPAQRRHQAGVQGMGLAAMEERVRMVGGQLSIWSQEGAGTRIAFDIPYFTETK